MFKHKHYFFILIGIFICCLSLSSVTFATQNNSLDTTIDTYYKTVRENQKQLLSILEKGYSNNTTQKSNDKLIGQLSIYSGNVDNFSNKLVHETINSSSEKEQNSKLQTLVVASGYLKFIKDQINEFLIAEDSLTQFSLLKDILQANSLLNQILAYL